MKMSFQETDIKELSSQDHEVLGSDFCSGYTDVFGKWNTGFDCPRTGDTVYCCGTATYKYCCTRRDQHSAVGISHGMMLGTVLGSVLMIVLVAVVTCLACKRCPPFRRSHPSLGGGPMYSVHCGSTASGMYSFSGQNTAATTPLDNPHVLADLDGTEHVYAQLSHQRELGRQLLRNGIEQHPSDPPPPYNERVPDSEETAGLTTRFVTQAQSERTGSNAQRTALSNPRRDGDVTTVPNGNVYWSTKF